MAFSPAEDVFFTLPTLVLMVGALAILVSDAVAGSKPVSHSFPIIVLFFSAVFALYNLLAAQPAQTVWDGLLYADPYSALVSFIVITGAILALMLTQNRLAEQGIAHHNEYYSLYLLAAAGALIFVTAAELVTLFVGLELMSLALYALCGSALRIRRSSESALKYFLLGSFSSAFLLYGIALLYALTGTTCLYELPAAMAGIDSPVLHSAMALVLAGLIFKIGGAPFHFWTPDVYEGAPTSVTAYMSTAIKAAAVAVLLRVVWTVFPGQIVFWSWALSAAAILSMCLGNVIALSQRSVKRMLAYSSIAHAGYMLVAFLGQDRGLTGGGGAVLYYLVAYTFMTIGAFAVVLAVTGPYSDHHHPDDLSRFNGLAQRRPILSLLMALFMLSLAGLPPGMAGLLAKFYVFSAAMRAEYLYLVIIGVVNSAISCYYYLRVVVALYFVPAPDTEEPVAALGPSMIAALAVCAIAVVLAGLFPAALYAGLLRIAEIL